MLLSELGLQINFQQVQGYNHLVCSLIWPHSDKMAHRKGRHSRFISLNNYLVRPAPSV